MGNFLVVDFEFSVPRSYGKPRAWFPEITEVGAVLAGPLGDPTDQTYSAFIKPRFWPRMTEENYAITGIRQEDVDGGVGLETSLDDLRKMSPDKNTWLVAWGDSDRKVLGSVCEKYGLDYPFVWDNYLDLAEEYKSFCKLERRASLKRAIEENEIPQIGILHSALDDAINAAQVMAWMIQNGWVMKGHASTEEMESKVASAQSEKKESRSV
ncbi:3'-5' exonuclease KapD [Desulfitobacterium sp.]|uniref:3'-5' exonuclease KapD n=1 Tax=Desulfitobacterium sp. TaxID=49981 RepID=UPI002B675B49|nr:3'-5' exonuclease KapD [Desulfitobacterium sp.]HVJ48796.1 3'-5' exonuclease KapD [Desulfitobacterium sp.]